MSKRAILLEAAKQIERCGARIRHANDAPIVLENIEELEDVIRTIQEHIKNLKSIGLG